MKSSRANRWALAVALLFWAVPSLAQDWSGKGRLQGTVTDEAGKPVVGARVTLHSPKDPNVGPPPLKTDKKGHWAYLGLFGGTWTITIEAEGYVNAEGPWDVSEITYGKPLNITLKKITQEMLEAQKPKPSPTQQAIDQGDALLKANQPAEARANYEKALADVTDPSNRFLLLKRVALCYQAESAHDKAIETLNEALEIQPGEVGAERMLAQSLGESHQTDKAIAILKDLFDKNPDDAAIGQTLVDTLTAAGKTDEARAYIAKLPSGTKVDPTSLLNIGITQYNGNQLQEALTSFDQVVQQDPQNADAYYYRGLAYLALKKMPEARADFKKVLELAPPDSEHAKDAKEFLKY